MYKTMKKQEERRQSLVALHTKARPSNNNNINIPTPKQIQNQTKQHHSQSQQLQLQSTSTPMPSSTSMTTSSTSASMALVKTEYLPLTTLHGSPLLQDQLSETKCDSMFPTQLIFCNIVCKRVFNQILFVCALDLSTHSELIKASETSTSSTSQHSSSSSSAEQENQHADISTSAAWTPASPNRPRMRPAGCTMRKRRLFPTTPIGEDFQFPTFSPGECLGTKLKSKNHKTINLNIIIFWFDLQTLLTMMAWASLVPVHRLNVIRQRLPEHRTIFPS
jgi:hypothetical protein